MSYEGYQAPSLAQSGARASAPGRETFTAPSLDDNAGSSTAIQFNNSQQSQSSYPYSSSNQNAFSGPEGGSDDPAVTYLCGDCDQKVVLKKNDPIRCTECGYRVIYKERTKRMIQFEAR